MRLTPRHAITWTAFLLNGVLFAMWVSHLPALQKQFAFSHGDLGWILLLVTVGNLLALRPTTAAVARFGPGPAGAVGLSVMALSLTLTALPGLPVGALAALALAFGAGFACSDLAMNTSGARIEAQLGRSVMSGLHGGFSVGLILGAVVSSGLMHAGVGTLTTYVLGAVSVAAGILIARRYDRLSERDPSSEVSAASLPSGRDLWTLAPLLLLGLSAAMIEGTVNDWTSVYMQNVLGASLSVAPLGLAAFALTMTAGRLLIGDRLARQYGARLPGAVGSLTVAAGLILALMGGNFGADGTGLALTGFGLTGLGLSFLAPLVFSAVARHKHPAALGILSGVFYTGYLISPALTGLLSNTFGLRSAFVVPAALAIVSAAIWLAQHRERAVRGAAQPS